MDQPSILDIPLWENYKKNIFFVIREGLTLLRQQSGLPTVEQCRNQPSLNRDLYRCIRKVCRQDKTLLYHLPVYEGQNPPDQCGEPSSGETKIPDFYWHISNPWADDDEAELRFVLECKRLGKPPRSDWILNENYVLNGICRFLTDSHEYGKGDAEGGMIGYIQSMEIVDIWKEVNQAIDKSPVHIEVLLPSVDWVEKGISEFDHTLERSFPISPFRLHHFWVDIRTG